jgi:hypothetical protein
MEIETFSGLPAHPLVVHAAVVLLPLAVVGLVVVAASSRMRERLALPVLVLALAATAAVVLAQGSGEALEERLEDTELTDRKEELVEDHAGKGERVLPWSIGVSIAALAAAGVERRERRGQTRATARLTAMLVAAALVAGAGSAWSVVDVGHSGARATWDELPAATDDD